jgi:cystathionine beta-synthase
MRQAEQAAAGLKPLTPAKPEFHSASARLIGTIYLLSDCKGLEKRIRCRPEPDDFRSKRPEI